MNRRSFFGFLGGAMAAVAATEVVSAAQGFPEPAPQKGALRIDEWDLDGIHHILIVTEDDIDLSVMFDTPHHPPNHVHNHSAQVLIPLAQVNPQGQGLSEEGIAQKIATLKRLSKTRCATIITHKTPKRTLQGESATVFPLLVEKMRLLVPVRLLTSVST